MHRLYDVLNEVIGVYLKPKLKPIILNLSITLSSPISQLTQLVTQTLPGIGPLFLLLFCLFSPMACFLILDPYIFHQVHKMISNDLVNTSKSYRSLLEMGYKVRMNFNGYFSTQFENHWITITVNTVKIGKELI